MSDSYRKKYPVMDRTDPDPRPVTHDRPMGAQAIVSKLDGVFYTISQVSEMLDIPVSTLRKWYRNVEELQAPSKQVKRGKMKIYLYTPEDVEELRAYRQGGNKDA